MMKKQVLGIIIVVALSLTIASAELVGSLHLETGQATNGVDRFTGYTTRTNSGDIITRGTVAGNFSFLAAVTNGTTYDGVTYDGLVVKTWSSTTVLNNFDRFAGSPPTGIAVWDYDLSGLSTNAWELKVDYTGRRAADPVPDEWYISFNGLGYTLDTTDVSTLEPGEGYALVTDVTKYVKIGDLPAGAAAGVNNWNVTEIIEAAISNGGNVRVVYSCDGYLDDITFNSDSGLIAADITAGDPVVLPSFYIADDFETGSGEVPINGWTESGPEPKEYNSPTNQPGVLNLRDRDADEKSNGGTHDGYWDTLTFALEDGINLLETNDWVQLNMDLGIYQDDSGAAIPSGRRLRVSLTDSSAPSNSGFGFLLQTGTESTWSQLRDFNSATSYGDKLGSGSYAHPFDGTMAPLFMKVTRVAGGYDIEASWGGAVFDDDDDNTVFTVTNSLAQTFDTLTVTALQYDFAFKLDDVYLYSNVKPILLTPYEKWSELYGLEGTNAWYTANPDGDELINAYEWGLGGNPTNVDQGLAQGYAASGTLFTYTYPSNLFADDLSYSIETCDDLIIGAWTNDGSVTVVGTGIHSGDDKYAAVTNGVSTAVKDEQFLKLIIDHPTP